VSEGGYRWQRSTGAKGIGKECVVKKGSVLEKNGCGGRGRLKQKNGRIKGKGEEKKKKKKGSLDEEVERGREEETVRRRRRRRRRSRRR
jgi:hypothetical protein